MNLEVKRFHKALVDDFYRLHGAGNNAGWCFCVAWWVDGWNDWSGRTAAQNRRRRDRLLDSGEYDGYLLFLDKEPVGWCQVGPRDRLAKLTAQFDLNPDPETWAITCFLIKPGHRRSGLAGILLHNILHDLKKRGIKRVEAYPKRGIQLADLDLWNGPEQLYLRAGFSVVSDSSSRPVLGLELSEFRS